MPSQISTWRFMAMIYSRLFSSFGTYLDVMLFNVLVLAITGSPKWIGYITMARVLPGVLFGPMIGKLVVKVNNRSLLIASDLCMGLLVLAVLAVPRPFIPWYVLGLMILSGFWGSVSLVAQRTSVPKFPLDAKWVNGVLTCGGNVSIAIAGLFCIVFGATENGFTQIILLDVATYVLAALALLVLDPVYFEGGKSKEEQQPTAEQNQGVSANAGGLSSLPILAFFLGLMFVDGFGSASHQIAQPVISKAYSSQQPLFLYGLILGTWGLGNLLGYYLLKWEALLSRLSPRMLYGLFTALMSMGFIIVFASTNLALITLGGVLAGIGDGVYQVYFAMIAQALPVEKRSKVFAWSNTLVRAGLGLGLLLYPYLLEKAGPFMSVTFFHGTIILSVMAFIALLTFSSKEKVEDESPECATE